MIRLLVLVLVFIGNASAAPDFDKIEKVRSELRAQKTSIVLESMQLSEEEEKTFLPIYDEYNKKLMLIRDQRLAVIKKYFNKYSEMDDKLASEIAKQVLGLDKERGQLREVYYKKMAKALSPIIAIRFLQIDNQLSTLLNVLRVRTIPLIKTSEEVSNEFGLGMSSVIAGDASAAMEAKTEDKMNRRIEEEREKKGL